MTQYPLDEYRQRVGATILPQELKALNEEPLKGIMGEITALSNKMAEEKMAAIKAINEKYHDERVKVEELYVATVSLIVT